MRMVLPSHSWLFTSQERSACHARPAGHLLAEEVPPSLLCVPTDRTVGAPSPPRPGKGAERRREAGGVVLLIVGSQKVVLSSHLYHPMTDLLYAWVWAQCPKQLLLSLVPSCHVGHTELCLSSSITSFSTLSSWLLPRYKNAPRKRDKSPF